jgi:hypothetical protein
VNAQYDTRSFALPFDRNGINRGSHGFSVDGGIDAEVTHLIVGRVYAGYLQQHYKTQTGVMPHPQLPDVTGFDFGAALTWTPDPLWVVKLEAAHIVNDTTLNSSSEDDQKIQVNVDWYLREYLALEGKIGYLDANFPHHLNATSTAPSPRRDQYLDLGAGAKYIMNDWMALRLAYDYERRSSNSAPILGAKQGFSDNQVSLTLLLQE